MTRMFRSRWMLLAAEVLALAMIVAAPAARAQAQNRQNQAPPTVEEARKFIEEAENRLNGLSVEQQRASWVQSTYITQDTEAIAAGAAEAIIAAGVEYAKGAARFDGVELPADLRRRMNLLKQTLTLAAPGDPAKNAELSRLAVGLESAYGAAKYCRKEGECLDLEQLSDIIEQSRDPKELLDVWVGWHNTARPMRADYVRLVELANEGARELGYKDTGAMWRSKYDMDPDAFSREVDRLWGQVKPLYDALHCHVRAKLNEKYGNELVPLDQPIPAHLLGTCGRRAGTTSTTWSPRRPPIRATT